MEQVIEEACLHKQGSVGGSCTWNDSSGCVSQLFGLSYIIQQSMKHRVTFLGCVFYAHHMIFKKSHLMQIVTKFSIAWRQFYQKPPSFLFPTALSGRLLGKKKNLFLNYNWIKIFLTSLGMQNYLSQISMYVQKLSIFQHGLSIENINPKVSKALKKSEKSILHSMLTPLCHWFHRKARSSAEVAHWASLHHKVISQPDLLCHKTSVLSFSGLLRRRYGMGVERSGACRSSWMTLTSGAFTTASQRLPQRRV